MGDNRDHSAWECGNCYTRPEECYLHNFLPEMPDLNLHNKDVRDEIKVSFDLKYSSVEFL